MGSAEQALVIDDDDEFCQWARSVLEQEGFDVVTTSEPKDAIQLVYASEPAVVLVDIALGNIISNIIQKSTYPLELPPQAEGLRQTGSGI